MKKYTLNRIASALLLLFASASATAGSEDIAKAEALMQQGKAAEAYEILAPQESELAGDIKYDYLLGVTALDSGKPDVATLAFERVLAANPNFAGARLDLARAYFAMGNLAQAKTEFEAVLTQNPPENAKAAVMQHLAAIEAKTQARKGGTTGYVELTAGYDDNVNNSANQSQIYIPVFGTTLPLAPTNVKRADGYAAFGAGVEHTVPLDAQWSAYAGADLKYRTNIDEKQFNTLSLDARAGLSREEDSDTWRGGVLWGRYISGGNPNNYTSGVNAEWRRLLDPQNQVSLFAQYSRLRYVDDALVSNNTNLTIGGGGWLHSFDLPSHPLMFISLFSGRERETEIRADGNKHLDGLRFGGQLSIDDKTDLFASVGAQVGRYDRKNVAFQNYRRDAQYSLNLGMAWRGLKDWSVKPQLAYSRNDSNLAIYEYDRTDLSVTLRHEFR